jgi:thiamine pyrophosphokinase
MKLNKPRRAIDIIACDGASEFLRKNNLIPQDIIGDMDGTTKQTLEYYKSKKVSVKKVIDQNRNDLEKALGYAVGKKYKRVYVIGFSGKRFDHTLNNLSVLKKFHKKTGLILYDDNFEMRFVSEKTEFGYRDGKVVSLIPLPKASGITTYGLKYALKNGKLEFGVKEGALNESIGSKVSISIKSGILLVIKEHFGVIG